MVRWPCAEQTIFRTAFKLTPAFFRLERDLTVSPRRVAQLLTIANGATFQLDAASQTVGQISGSGAINLGGGTLNVNTPLGNVYSGVVRDSDLGANPTTAQGHGLRGDIMHNQDFTALLAVRDDAAINFPDFSFADILAATNLSEYKSVLDTLAWPGFDAGHRNLHVHCPV